MFILLLIEENSTLGNFCYHIIYNSIFYKINNKKYINRIKNSFYLTKFIFKLHAVYCNFDIPFF